MTSLSFPDVNVWLALAAPEHVHHGTRSAGRKGESWDQYVVEVRRLIAVTTSRRCAMLQIVEDAPVPYPPAPGGIFLSFEANDIPAERVFTHGHKGSFNALPIFWRQTPQVLSCRLCDDQFPLHPALVPGLHIRPV